MTLVPVRMYFKNGRVKVAVSLAKGKKDYDKRETIKRREADRETRAAIKIADDRIRLDATMPKVPLLDLQAQYRPLRDEILAAMTRVSDSQRFIMGPEVDALERELARMLGVRHAIAVSSGTDALLLALMALDIKAGDEVDHDDLFVLRDGRLRRRGWARGRCSWTSIR